MDKKKIILTSLASVAVLGAALAASQPSLVKAEEQPTASQPAGETGTKSEVTSPEIKQAEADAKAAEAKVTEAQAKVDTTTPVADEATKKLETEKKRS